ncbi:MAG: VCBS repeat-containing protein [Deltaproteobacteria bacterium]|nr:VCBS repeat-containing protein [Deltaproteobacteria bacterium]MDH4122047.1 VCBS repeat-containing protein [Deltaproteobacteria bacterium]
MFEISLPKQIFYRLVLGAGLVGGVCLCGGQALAQRADGFSRYTLTVERELAEVLAADVSGDGLKDLVVVEVDRTRRVPRYFVSTAFQSAGGFPERSQSVGIPSQTMMVGVMRLKQGAALALLVPGRVEIWPWEKDRFDEKTKKTLAVNSLFPVAAGELKTEIRWVYDLNGDGQDELLIPGFDEITVAAQDAHGKWMTQARLPTHPTNWVMTLFNSRILAWDMSDVRLVDLDKNGWKDVLVFNDNLLLGYMMGPTPQGRANPAIRLDLSPPKPFDRNQPLDPPLWLHDARDLNGDGLVDLVFTKTAPTDSAFKSNTRTLVYYGQAAPGDTPSLKFVQKPDQVFLSEGFSLPLLNDNNADGLVDLVVVNVDISFWNAVKGLISRTMSAEASYFFMGKNKRYPTQPNAMETYSVKFSLGRYDHQPIVAFGDLNADHLPDLMLSIDKDNMGIHWGRPEGTWSPQHNRLLRDFLPITPRRFEVVDLNNDGRDDILITYIREDLRKMPELTHAVTVLISRLDAKSAQQDQ